MTYKESAFVDKSLVVHHAFVEGLGNVGNFSNQNKITDTTHCFFNDIAVGPAGILLVACQDRFQSPPEGPNRLLVALGYGGLFDFPHVIASTEVGIDENIAAQPNRHIGAEVGLAYDRTNIPGVGHPGRAYLVYTDEVLGAGNTDIDDTDVIVRFSDNNGGSWSSPVTVNYDDTTKSSQFLPRIAVDQTTGHVAVSWHDCRNDDGGSGAGNRKSGANNDAQLWASISVDGGVTFQPNFQVSQGTSDEKEAEPYIINSDDLDYGDYTGLAFQSGYFYPAWADNSNSTEDNEQGGATSMEIYTAKVLPEPIQIFALISGTTALCGLYLLRVRYGGARKQPSRVGFRS